MSEIIITHIGNGEFNVKLSEEKTVTAGPNLCGMIRYTYFEDFELPELNWTITQKQLHEDYFKKITQAIEDGTIPKEGGEF